MKAHFQTEELGSANTHGVESWPLSRLGHYSPAAALGVLGAVQAEVQEMNQAIEANQANVLNLLCGISNPELDAVQGSVVIRQLFDEHFPGTLQPLIARQVQA